MHVDNKQTWSDQVTNVAKSFASKLSLLRRMQFLLRKQLEDFYTKVILPSVTYGLLVWGSCNKTYFSNLKKLHARAGRIVYELSWETSTADVFMQTRWDSLERMYKVRLAEFTFKCIKGYNATKLKDLFVQRNSRRESRRNGETVLPSSETNFMRNSIKYRGAITWNSLSSKESAANNLNQFKRLLSKFDIRKINFDPIAAVINYKNDDYIYF